MSTTNWKTRKKFTEKDLKLNKYRKIKVGPTFWFIVFCIFYSIFAAPRANYAHITIPIFQTISSLFILWAANEKRKFFRIHAILNVFFTRIFIYVLTMYAFPASALLMVFDVVAMLTFLAFGIK